MALSSLRPPIYNGMVLGKTSAERLKNIEYYLENNRDAKRAIEPNERQKIMEILEERFGKNESSLRAVEIDRAIRSLHLRNSSIFDIDDERAVGKALHGEKMTEEEIEAADDN